MSRIQIYEQDSSIGVGYSFMSRIQVYEKYTGIGVEYR